MIAWQHSFPNVSFNCQILKLEFRCVWEKEVGILKRFDSKRILLISRDDLRDAKRTRCDSPLIRGGKNWRTPSYDADVDVDVDVVSHGN